MGFEVTLNAIPPRGAILEAVRRQEFNPELLCFLNKYYRERHDAGHRWDTFVTGDADRKRFVNVLELMIMEVPSIVDRQCELGRRFAWLEWTLARVSTDNSRAELANWAINGRDVIAAEAVSVQGFPIRWLQQDVCGTIAEWLGDIGYEEVVSVCDVARMRDDRPYKLAQQRNDELVCEAVAKDFEMIRSFYRQVAKHSEAVLIVKD